MDKVSFEGTVSKVLREPFECLMFEFEKVRTERSAGRQQAGRRRAKGGEPDSAAGVYPGERSPLILLEKLGTDCDDRERKYSLPQIFSVRVGTHPFRHPPTNPPVFLRARGIDGVRTISPTLLVI